MSMILDGTITFSDATVQSSSSNTYAPAYANTYSLGLSQTWQNVSASRSTGTTYYNTTGKPILVSVRSDVSVDGRITVNGVQAVWADQSASNRGPLVTIVPPGQSYVITGAYYSGSWSELR